MILNEQDYLDRLKQWTGDRMGAVKDMAMASAGSNRAVGKLNIRAATQKLINDWKQFCGERRQAGVEGYDFRDPTLNQIEQFLSLKYNVRINLGDVSEIADAAEEAGVEEGQPTDLKATTPSEYENLKKLATGDNVRAANPPGPAKRKSDPSKDKLRSEMNDEIAKDKAAGLPTRESIEESALFEDGNLLRKLFGNIALHLWDAGLLSVERGKKGARSVHDVRGKAAKDDYQSSGKGETNTADYTKGTAVDTKVDDNGNYLDALVLRKRLQEANVDSNLIHRLQTAIKGGNNLVELFSNAEETVQTEMVTIAAAMVGAMRKAPSTMRAGDNVTKDGNTINFNQFKSSLESYGVKDVGPAMAALKKADADGEISPEDVKAIMGKGDVVGKAVLGIMAATVQSIQKVQTKKAEAE